MARKNSVSDADRLIRGHRDLIAGMERICAYPETAKKRVVSAAEDYLHGMTMEALKEVPVEELGRLLPGVRMKLLREEGYRTMAELYLADWADLEIIRGISAEGATHIQESAKSFYKTTRQQVRIRLNGDQRTHAASYLVRMVFDYKRLQNPLEECRKLLRCHRKSIEEQLREVEAVRGLLRRLFASRQARDRADQACVRLDGLLRGTYGNAARSAIAAADGYGVSMDMAWEDFLSDPISYYSVLQELLPGSLGSEQVSGLPEELAREIWQEKLDLTGLRCTLRQYQQWGVKYIQHQKRVLLGDEMGLGKTVQAIAAMVNLRNGGDTHFMVVCPASVVTNWCREISRHSDLSVIKIHGQDRLSAFADWQEQGGVAVTTFETTLFLKPEESFQFAFLVVDEAHYIKNPEAKRTIHTKRLCAHAHRLLFMTGTALENRVDEMISLIGVLQPKLAMEAGALAFLASAPQFQEKIAPVYYRRKREDVLTELPELIENLEWCDPTQEELLRYEDAILNNRFADARRVSWNVENLNRSSKACRLREIVEEAGEEGRKVIVFSFFLDTIRNIRAFLGEICMDPITGALSSQRRQEIIDEFTQAPAGSVLISQIQSGGTGLNIQTASVVVLCEPQLKPSIENQAISRAYRMGQGRNVLVYRLLCEETIDERMLAMLEEKQAVFDAFADESLVAKHSAEIDQSQIQKMLQEEADRIRQKRGS